MLKDFPLAARVARCPGATIQEIVHRGGHDIPSVLESQSYALLGDADIPFERYTSRIYYEREMARMWPRVWQWACRGGDRPEPAAPYRLREEDSYAMVPGMDAALARVFDQKYCGKDG